MSNERTPPLTGVTVLEIGAFMAAPFATMQLADLGADVIKVENSVGGDPVRQTGPFVGTESSPFVRLNRNKRSVALNLKSPDARRAFLRLTERADVLVENLRPGAMRRLGLGYVELREINPRLIYASASGWGQDGPLAGLPGLDIMAQARSGLMSITGHPGGPPAKVGVPICDLVCALYLALAVTAALRERDRSGAGQYIDVSLFEAGVSFAVWEAGKYFATGQVGGPMGSAHQSSAPYQAVHSSDGYVTVGAITARNWAAFCSAFGLTRLLTDPRYADASLRLENRAELIESIETVTGTMTTAEIVRLLNEAGVPCAPIADYGQVFADHHLSARDYFWDAPHPTLGAVRQLGSPMRLSETPVRRGGAGPVLGADTREVLLAAGCTEQEIDELAASGAALAGHE
jgi:crotonobetainyl-CoA:carnitine CoA-transferase CaiB-like acyl-CoA transferase